MLREMKEQQQNSDREREQMILDRDNVIREQEELKLLNQQLSAQVVALQNNSVRRQHRGPGGSANIHTLDELIQKWIIKEKLPQHLISTTCLHDSPLSIDIHECELSRKFSTPTFDSYMIGIKHAQK